MLLIDYAKENGVAMGSIGPPGQRSFHIGWTTNEPMWKLRTAGASVVTGYGADPDNPGQPAGKDLKSANTPRGWEISFRQGADAILV